MSETSQGEYGTVFIPKKATEQQYNQPVYGKVSDRDMNYESIGIRPVGKYIQLKALNKVDVGYITLDGGEWILDFSDTLIRPYTLIVKATVAAVIEIYDADVTGYKTNPAKINVHRNQIIKIRATKAHEGSTNKWFVEVDGETDGLVQKVVLNGEEFIPSDDGTVTLRTSDDVERLIAEAVEKATLYWN